jgi:FlaA1/EpsC-like NDP-sugar epimerase
LCFPSLPCRSLSLFVHCLSRSHLILEGIFSITLLGGLRILIKVSQRYPGDIDWKKTGVTTDKRVLIVGAGNSGINIVKELKGNPHVGLQPAAFLDDDPKKIGMKTQGCISSDPSSSCRHQKRTGHR